MRKITIDNLFKQRYNEHIVARRDQLEQSKDPGKRLRAYNSAVAIELQALKEGSPSRVRGPRDTCSRNEGVKCSRLRWAA